MKFIKTSLADATLIELTRHGDARGYFARAFCAETFAREGLATEYPQANHSANLKAGTLRGMHYQRAPHAEAKLVRCVKGALFDVIIDLRPESPTHRRWEGFELSAGNGRMLYVPAGFAHGFQTLEDDTHAVYQVSYPYTPEAEGGVRWDDPEFGIAWPRPVAVISEKDAAWPLVGPA